MILDPLLVSNITYKERLSNVLMALFFLLCDEMENNKCMDFTGTGGISLSGVEAFS